MSYSQSDLRWITLAGNDLTNWSFAGQNLSGANLSYGTLTSANFANANLSGANLSYGTLTSANFANANLTNASLSSCAADGRDVRRGDRGRSRFQSHDLEKWPHFGPVL